MANTKCGNTCYVDTQYSVAADQLAGKNLRVVGIVLTATGANARLVLSDITGPTTKIDVRVGTSGESKHFRFEEYPINFPNGIRPSTLSNAVATIIISESGG